MKTIFLFGIAFLIIAALTDVINAQQGIAFLIIAALTDGINAQQGDYCVVNGTIRSYIDVLLNDRILQDNRPPLNIQL
ncbi:hypothetical protein K1T71_010403 [Dendrolimus kikuchii]|uniref:Uncharacterized protein n=1 Tax=Dendrolimus kikuchii TaxID=765133 RepID=A0ACC1CRM9_9NEOP|nr:hypothetical protein K1T71_010403 [Dendrolimus kikuchii]